MCLTQQNDPHSAPFYPWMPPWPWQSADLKEGGSDIEVTEDNKLEYLQLFAHHRLLDAIRHVLLPYEMLPRGDVILPGTLVLAGLRSGGGIIFVSGAILY